ncbi:hypothetical protein SRDD_36330 [Serratia sp. DD3]|nr:hypothetical protein SRDD_36330 [Serratia sp. DD3]
MQFFIELRQLADLEDGSVVKAHQHTPPKTRQHHLFAQCFSLSPPFSL